MAVVVDSGFEAIFRGTIYQLNEPGHTGENKKIRRNEL